MPKTHRCIYTNHIAAIAKMYDFQDWSTIWDVPANADLRSARRENPNLLFHGDYQHSGDSLTIPDKNNGSDSAKTDQHHVYGTRKPTPTLRLRVLGDDRLPLRRADYSLKIDGEAAARTGKTDKDGQIVVPPPKAKAPAPLPNGVSNAKLAIRVPSRKLSDGRIVGETHAIWDLRIGALNPLDPDRPTQCFCAMQQRLNNLGFPCGIANGKFGYDNPGTGAKDPTREAIRAFQATYGLGVDGNVGSPLLEKLKQVHDGPKIVLPRSHR